MHPVHALASCASHQAIHSAKPSTLTWWSWEGLHYKAAGAVIVPPIQQPRPPFVIAAQGPRGLRLVARYADAWNTLDGQPMRSAAADPVTLDQAVAATRSQIELLDVACGAIGRDPKTIRRSVLAYRAQVFSSTGAFEEYVVYWPAEPGTFAPRPEQEAVMERVAADVLPRFRADAAKT